MARIVPPAARLTLVTMRFHDLDFFLPVMTVLNISSSAMGLTLGRGTAHLPAFSFRFCFTVLESTFARVTPSRSSRYAGTAPFGTLSAPCSTSFSSCTARLQWGGRRATRLKVR